MNANRFSMNRPPPKKETELLPKDHIACEYVDGYGYRFDLLDGKYRHIYIDIDVQNSTQQGWETIDTLAGWIGVSVSLASKWVRELGITGRRDLDSEIMEYPPLTLVLLEWEMSWNDLLAQNGNTLSNTALGKRLGVSHGTISRLMTSQNIKHDVSGRIGRKEVDQVRQYYYGFKQAEGWLYGESTGWPYDMLQKIMGDATYGAEWRWSRRGKLLRHLSPRVISDINAQRVTEPAGERLTEQYIAGVLSEISGRNRRVWTHARLKRYKDLCETALNDSSAPYRHYPPWVLQELIDETIKEDEEMATHEDWPTYDDVAAALGISKMGVRHHVETRCIPTGYKLAVAKDGARRPVSCLEPSHARALIDERRGIAMLLNRQYVIQPDSRADFAEGFVGDEVGFF